MNSAVEQPDIILKLAEIGRSLGQKANLELLLEGILEASQSILKADGATIYRVYNRQFLKFYLLRNTSLNLARGGISQEPINLPDIPLIIDGQENHKSVVSHCTLSKQTVNITDAYDDTLYDFSQTKLFDQRTGYRTKSVLAIPILDYQGNVIAVMQFINCIENEEIVPFNRTYQSIAESLATQAGVAIENRLMIDQLSQSLAKEINEAAQYINSLLPAPVTGVISTSWQYIPCSGLGGDAFGCHWIDDDHFAIYLLDVCGHGVGSALMSVSAINTLRSQSLKNVDFLKPSSVLHALNNIYLMENHHGKFFTLWYGVYSKSERKLKFASAGHPAALLVSTDSTSKSELIALQTPNIAIGCFEDFEFAEDEIALKRFAKLYLYSDGVFEVEKSNGDMMCFSEFNDLMHQYTDPSEMQSAFVLKNIEMINANNTVFEDDFSLLEIIFN